MEKVDGYNIETANGERGTADGYNEKPNEPNGTANEMPNELNEGEMKYQNDLKENSAVLNGVDGVFSSLTKKYLEFRKKELKRNLLAAGIITAATFAFILTIVLVGAEESVENTVIVIFAALFIGGFMAVTVKNTYAQMKFSKENTGEIGTLQDFQDARDGTKNIGTGKKKLSLFDMADSQRLLDYLYPASEIQKKIMKINKYTIFGSIIAAIVLILGVAILGITAFESREFFAVSLYAAVCAAGLVVLTVLSTRSVLKCQRLQAEEFEKNPEYFRFHTELYGELKKNQNVNQIVQIVAAAVWGAGCAAAAFFGGGAFLTALFVGIIFVGAATYAAFLITYPKYRKKAEAIERKIDGHLRGENGK
jgi:hypothetical protein